MGIASKPIYLGAAAAAFGICVVLWTLAGSADAAKEGTPGKETVITFTEPEKGSSFHYVDNPPKGKRKHGFPTRISAGDELVIWNPLVSGGKQIGHLQAFCVATRSAKKFPNAEWECTGTYVLGGGTLTAIARVSHKGTEGAITGGTGSYVGASGVFVVDESVKPTKVTIRLFG
jgi:hypothetical protein